MSLHGASYFAGVGTVVATMAIGFGGGVMLTDAFVGKSEKTPTLMERRASPLSESTLPVVASAPTSQAGQQGAVFSAPAQPLTPEQATTPQQSAAAPAAAPSPTVSSQPLPQAAAAPATIPSNAQHRPPFEQSMGYMREADLREQEAETRKAAAAERRKQERRKWAERRKRDMQKIDELTAVTEKVKQATRERDEEPEGRAFVAESPRVPVISLFGGGDDD